MHSEFFYKLGKIIQPLVKLEFAWLLTGAVPLLLLFFLDNDLSNIWLALIITVMFGPSFFVMFRMSEFIEKSKDISYIKQYFSRLKKYFRGTLTIWIPYLLITGILLTNFRFVNFSTRRMDIVFQIIYLIIYLIISLIVLNMIVINSFFTFDYKSLFKLSIYYLFVDGLSTIKKIVIIGIMIATLFFLSNLFPIITASLWCYLIYISSKKMLKEIKMDYTK